MSDLIDRQAAIQAVMDLPDCPNGFSDTYDKARIIGLLEDLPCVELSERKKGKWMPFDNPWYECSECGAVRENKSFMENFCPNCGADMRGGEDDS